jgi:hypothetical protein
MRELTDLDHQTLDRILANRVALPRNDAERKRLERLYATGWVLYGKHRGGRYFFLSYRATVHFKIHRLYSRPPGYSCLVRALATTAACDRLGYERLSPWQFEQRFPELCGADLCQSQYCFSPEDKAIGFVHIDVAQPPKRINHRVGEIFAQRKARGKFRARIDAGKFFVLIATATERKRRQIEKALSTLASTELIVIPELMELL